MTISTSTIASRDLAISNCDVELLRHYLYTNKDTNRWVTKGTKNEGSEAETTSNSKYTKPNDGF